MTIRVKICCISSIEEAELAISAGAHALGLVSRMPSGPGPIPEELIAEIAARIPPGVDTFLLTSAQHVPAIIDQQRRCRVKTLQLVDRLEEGTYDELRAALPGVSIVQVIHVHDEDSLQEAIEVSRRGVDGLLLDSGNQKLAVKELGGTGRKHDWSISRQIVESVNVPVFLAGGLNPQNAAEAIRQVRPYGLDVCSGLRINGQLIPDKLRDFFTAIRSAG